MPIKSAALMMPNESDLSVVQICHHCCDKRHLCVSKWRTSRQRWTKREKFMDLLAKYCDDYLNSALHFFSTIRIVGASVKVFPVITL
jgi:hypothetical protein